jgi:TolB protein
VTGACSGASNAGPAAVGKIAFAVQHGDGDAPSDIYVVRTDGRTLVGKKTVLNEWDPAWSPDGRRIAFDAYSHNFQAGAMQIYTMNADGTHRRRLTRLTDYCRLGQWSPDGRRIVYSCGKRHSDAADIWVIDADGTRTTRLTPSQGATDSDPLWSRDGSQIVFTRASRSRSDVYVVNAKGGGERRLTRTGDSAAEAWMPGRKIVFARGVDEAGPASGIYVMNADGGDVRRVTTRVGLYVSFVVGGWSPDARVILFADGRGISTVRPSDRFVRTLVRAGGSASSWAPGGRQIVFTRTYVGRQSGLWIVNRDGSGARRIVAVADPADSYYEPAWAPR